MADCYANENFTLPVVRSLRHLGHNLLTTYESGKAGRIHSELEAYSDWVGRLVRINRPA